MRSCVIIALAAAGLAAGAAPAQDAFSKVAVLRADGRLIKLDWPQVLPHYVKLRTLPGESWFISRQSSPGSGPCESLIFVAPDPGAGPQARARMTIRDCTADPSRQELIVLEGVELALGDCPGGGTAGASVEGDSAAQLFVLGRSAGADLVVNAGVASAAPIRLRIRPAGRKGEPEVIESPNHGLLVTDDGDLHVIGEVSPAVAQLVRETKRRIDEALAGAEGEAFRKAYGVPSPGSGSGAPGEEPGSAPGRGGPAPTGGSP